MKLSVFCEFFNLFVEKTKQNNNAYLDLKLKSDQSLSLIKRFALLEVNFMITLQYNSIKNYYYH